MKQLLKKVISIVFGFVLIFGAFSACFGTGGGGNGGSGTGGGGTGNGDGGGTVIEEPLGDPIIIDLDEFRNPYGYASLTITNRKSVAASRIAVVANEVEFLDALLDRSKTVIKITENLDMGYNNVVKKLKQAGKSDSEIASKYANETKYNLDSVFRRNPALPKTHPDLKESGIGQLLIQNRSELMIYSETGISIKHMTTWIRGTNSKPVNNIVIRNLVLTDIWEWDEASFGQYDQNDWDYFTIERASDIWIDHITFGNSYDGTADVKLNCKNITFSWLDMDFPIIDSVRRQKEYLDENIDDYPYYKEVKELFEGQPEEDFLTYLSSQKKGFNLGNTTDGPGFEEMTVTLHHIKAYNLQDRLPRIRKGDAHMYNVLTDNTDLSDVKQRTGQNITNQAIVPTEDGAVLMENSKFISVNEPIKTHQESNPDPKYSGKFKVVNSQIVTGGITFLASTPSTVWTSASSLATEKPFYLRNYQYIPYNYNMVEPHELANVFTYNLVGAGELKTEDGEPFDWKEIMRSLGNPVNAIPDGHKINSNIEMPQANVELGTKYIPHDPKVYNFYKPTAAQSYAQLVEGTDYELEIDKSTVPVDSEGNTNQKGVYYVLYKLTSLKDDQDVCYLRQTVVVFDQNDFSVPSFASNEFNTKTNLTFQANMPSGQLYYLLSSEDLNLDSSYEIIKTNGVSQAITTTSPTIIKDIYTNDNKYIYTFIEDGAVRGQIQKITLRLEKEVEINSEEEFIRVAMQTNDEHSYYKLTKDLDFAGKESLIKRTQFEDGTYLNSDAINVVFDGQGHTVKNLVIEQIDPGLNAPSEWTDPRRGLFGRADNCVIKNFNFVDCGLSTTKDANHTGFLFELSNNYLEVENVSMKGINVTSHKSGYAAAVVGLINTGTIVMTKVSLIDSTILGTKNYNGGLIGGNKTMGINYIFKDLYLDNVDLNRGKIDLQYAGLVVGRFMGLNSKMTLDGIAVYNSRVEGVNNLGLVFAKTETGSKFEGRNIFFSGNEVVLPQEVKSGGLITGNYNTTDDPTQNKLMAYKVFLTKDNVFKNGIGTFDYADKTRKSEDDEGNTSDLCVVELMEVDSVSAAWFAANLDELNSARGWTFTGGKLVLTH